MICRTFLPLLIVAMLFVGCDEGGKIGGTEYDPTHELDSQDPGFIGAVAKASESIQTFVVALQEPEDTYSNFAIKRRFKDGDKVEFMWLTDLTFDDGVLMGKLSNEPTSVSNAKIGKTYAVKIEDAVDWAFMDDGDLNGGFTIKLFQTKKESNTVH